MVATSSARRQGPQRGVRRPDTPGVPGLKNAARLFAARDECRFNAYHARLGERISPLKEGVWTQLERAARKSTRARRHDGGAMNWRAHAVSGARAQPKPG